jgi:alkanesulfonate monooxygenase SsuD/methylene tetrahydromethanopterin reductase-like flavin-dependent oxidoreductase (luciferase family)
MELGIYSFGEATPDPETSRTITAHERVQRLLDEIELADKVGLDVYGLGEHHRREFVVSAPAVVLAAAAARTKRIRLTSAVSVISSDDPVRVFQNFATLDLISNGRAEIMAGRGSFTESFPLFGYDLADYDDLFEEKLDLLLKIRQSERVTWRGTHRAPIEDLPVFPRPVQDPLPVWIAEVAIPSRWFARAGSGCRSRSRSSAVSRADSCRSSTFIAKPAGVPATTRRSCA